MCLHVHHMCAGVPGGQARVLAFLELELPSMGAGMLGNKPLQEQVMLLTAEAYLQPANHF